MNKDQTKTLSKFYYTIKIKQNNTSITIGLHQEDNLTLGGHLRQNIDSGIVILQEDEDSYWIHDFFELRKERDYFFTSTFEKGTYHIIPITTGTLLRRPFQQKIKTVNVNLISPYKYSHLHPYVDSVLSDIFRKVDLMCNSLIDAQELNGFGNLIKNKHMQTIISQDFNKKNFNKASCTKKGLTEFGFKSIIMEQVIFEFIFNSITIKFQNLRIFWQTLAMI